MSERVTVPKEAWDALLDACRAWADNGWCVHGPKGRPDCTCDWHKAKAALVLAGALPKGGGK